MTASAGALAIGEARGTTPLDRVLATSRAVAATEDARAKTGRIRSFDLTAAAISVDLGGRVARTWGYSGQVPYRELRVMAGDELNVAVSNQLPVPTTVHWHGLALRNDMDGVPGVSQPAIAPGSDFTYRFTAPHPGTYWFHPHVGVQLDTGLMGPLIIEDPREPLGYDQDVTLVLDDWTDGVAASPNSIVADLGKNGMKGMGSMGSMDAMRPNSTGRGISRAAPLGDDTGDVDYPLHLINAKPPNDPFVVTAKPGARLRLRLINAGSDTAYQVQVGGHRLSVVHSDGYPTEPTTTGSVLLGMGERYDIIVHADDGAFPIIATPVGKSGQPALAVLRTSPSARTPKPVTTGMGSLLSYADLRPDPAVALSTKRQDRTLRLELSTKGGGRQWLINGRAYPHHEPLDVTSGERVRLVMTNRTMMFHPMHLHGHTFALSRQGGPGVRKDTVNVLPMQRLAIDLEADNPGQWLVHCHNAYHGELGMMTVLSYVQ